MSTLITVLHVITCMFLMLTVLLQSGKGGGMGGAFGGGNTTTMFGGGGASTFLRKLTAGAGTIFMLTSMILAFIASHNSADSLEKFGEQQANLAEQKDKAKEKALEDAKKAGPGSAGPTSSTPFNGPDGLPATIKLPDGREVPLQVGSGAPPVQLGSGTAPAVPAEMPAPTTPVPAKVGPATPAPAPTTPAPAKP